MQKILFLTLLILVPVSVFGQQSIECQVARQQILAAVNAQAQARAQAQANEQRQAQRRAERYDPAQALQDSFAQIGRGVGMALGAEDELQAQERRIQEAIQQYKSVCER